MSFRLVDVQDLNPPREVRRTFLVMAAACLRPRVGNGCGSWGWGGRQSRVSPKWSSGCLLGLADVMLECTGGPWVVLYTLSRGHVSFMQQPLGTRTLMAAEVRSLEEKPVDSNPLPVRKLQPKGIKGKPTLAQHLLSTKCRAGSFSAQGHAQLQSPKKDVRIKGSGRGCSLSDFMEVESTGDRI